jgi:F-type H+-transporting ATPase subunit delta
MSTDVARRYADALVELAAEQNILEQVSSELEAFDSTLANSAPLISALRNPVFSLEERQGVIGAVLERAGVVGITRNFLFLLIENRRVDALSDIVSAFEDRVDDRLGRVRASVTSAVPLGDEMLGEIEKQIQHLTGKGQVLLSAEVDPALIGGIVTRVGDMVFDGSIRTQLSAIRNQLLGQAAVGEA